MDTRCFRAEEVDQSSNGASCSAAAERTPQAKATPEETRRRPSQTRLSAIPQKRPQGNHRATTQRRWRFHAPSSQPSTTYAASFSRSAASPSASPSPDPSAQHSGATCGPHRVGRRCSVYRPASAVQHHSRGKDILRDNEAQKELVEPCHEERDSRRCQSTCQYSQHHQAGCAHHVCCGCEQDRFTSNSHE